ncbi:MAG: hypothetical protein LUH10_01820 [Tannerellaceae bacterium]|nr:hypothetical protein [Tannerellaceae bacterium]
MNYYYYNAGHRTTIEGAAGLEEAVDLFYAVKPAKGSFFGITNEEDRTLQFAWEKGNTWLVDVPVPERKGSYSKPGLTHAECVAYIKAFYEQNEIDLSGLQFAEY